MHWHWPLTASPQVRIAGQVQVTDAYLRGGPLYRNFSRSCSVVGVIGNVSGQTKICNLIRDNRIRLLARDSVKYLVFPKTICNG